ncbi:hypothetical protein FRC03_001734 [Tulasnella sp. 419]|nr:hypothetical protein FRC03_001734 [Tulasnella sp. 419]
MFCTPSTRTSAGHMRRTSTPTRPQRHSHHHSPSHESHLVPSPTFVFLNSPNKSGRASTSYLAASFANGSASDSDTYSDEDEENRAPTADGVLRSPTTPAGRKHSTPSSVDFSVPRRPRSLKARISKTPLANKPLPAAVFTTTTPQDVNTDWRTFGGDECLTRLSLKDNEEGGSRTTRGKERKRTESPGSYVPARHRKTTTPPNSLGHSFASSYTDKPLFLSQRSPLSSRSRKNNKMTSPQISHVLPPLMIDSANILSPTSSFATPTSNSIFATQLPVEPLDLSQPSSPIASISASTSTASSNFSFDDVKPLPEIFKPRRLTRKFRPRDSGVAGLGDESDGDLALGDVSFGSSSSLSNVEEDPLTTEKEDGSDGGLPIATPLFSGNDNSGWPRESSWTTVASVANTSFVDDSDQLLLHMAKAANGTSLHSKPVMPDTPMKKHPARMRAWQSTGKSWGLGTASSSGTLKAVPRKSLPLRIPDFQQSSPGSPESDPSPSKNGLATARTSLADRRRSYNGVGLGLPQQSVIPPLPISASESSVGDSNVLFGSGNASPSPFSNATIPLFGRAELLRRTSSGAHSSNSEQSSDGTPTKRHSIPLMWKAPNPFSPRPTESPESNFEGTPSQSSCASPLPPLTSLLGGASSPAQPTPIRLSLGAMRKSAPNVFGQQPPLLLSLSQPSPSPSPSPSAIPRPSATLPLPKPTLKHARPSLPASMATPSHYPRSILKRETIVPVARAKSPGLIPSNPAVARVKAIASPAGSPLPASSSRQNVASRLARRSGGELSLMVPGKSKASARTRTRSDVGTRARLDELDLILERKRRMELTNVVIEERPGYFEEYFTKAGDGIGVLGKGTFGKVFKVRVKNGLEENETDTKYAVKVSKPYEGERHRARLLEEVDILRHLKNKGSFGIGHDSGYDNVLHYIDAWEQDRTLYIQTELCELGNLSEFLLEYGRQFDRLDEPRLWKILSELARGIGHIHRSGVIHLDLKPANVFVTGEGRLRIGDFGMATRWPRTGTEAGSTIAGSGFEREGDREYLAAEILQGRYGPEADMFSFGMMMLEAAGNIVVPSNGDAWHRLRNEDFSEVTLAGLSPTIVTLVTTMMATDPLRRPTIEAVLSHPSVTRTLAIMKHNRDAAKDKAFRASAFVSEPPTFLETVLGNDAFVKTVDDAMDLS